MLTGGQGSIGQWRAAAGSGCGLEGRVVLVSGGQVLGLGVYWRAWYGAGQWRAAAWYECGLEGSLVLVSGGPLLKLGVYRRAG